VLPSSHVAASGIIGVFVWLHFKSFDYAIVSFVAGTFIDLDHVIDYYLNHSFTLKVRKIYNACLKMNLKKVYLLLHSYEIVILLWYLIYAMPLGNFWKAVAIGLTQHLIFDQITNPLNTYGYFLTYRIMKGFKKELLLQ